MHGDRDPGCERDLEVSPHVGGPTAIGFAANLQWAAAAGGRDHGVRHRRVSSRAAGDPGRQPLRDGSDHGRDDRGSRDPGWGSRSMRTRSRGSRTSPAERTRRCSPTTRPGELRPVERPALSCPSLDRAGHRVRRHREHDNQQGRPPRLGRVEELERPGEHPPETIDAHQGLPDDRRDDHDRRAEPERGHEVRHRRGEGESPQGRPVRGAEHPEQVFGAARGRPQAGGHEDERREKREQRAMPTTVLGSYPNTGP